MNKIAGVTNVSRITEAVFSTLKWADFNVKPRAASLQILPHAELLFGKMWLFFFGHLISYIKKMFSSELPALNKVNLQHPSKQ